MRFFLAVAVMLGWPVVAAAQSAAPAPGSVPPLPPIGLPLPQIGLPHPPMGLPVPAAPQAHRAADPPERRFRTPHQPAIYVVPLYMWPYLYIPPPAGTQPGSSDQSTTRAQQPPRTGRLQLDVQPEAGQQIYVDGYYVGTPDDFRDGLEIDAGPHAVEIRAAGYATLDVPININPGRSTTYRGTLSAIGPTAAPAAVAPDSGPAAPRTPMTVYIIPGCYIGNVPPAEAGLPAGCDLSRATTITR